MLHFLFSILQIYIRQFLTMDFITLHSFHYISFHSLQIWNLKKVDDKFVFRGNIILYLIRRHQYINDLMYYYNIGGTIQEWFVVKFITSTNLINYKTVKTSTSRTLFKFSKFQFFFSFFFEEIRRNFVGFV